MNREAIIATLTLLGWQAQMSIVIHVGRGLQVGVHTLRVRPLISMRPFFASDGWSNFGTESLEKMLEEIQAYDHEP